MLPGVVVEAPEAAFRSAAVRAGSRAVLCAAARLRVRATLTARAVPVAEPRRAAPERRAGQHTPEDGRRPAVVPRMKPGHRLGGSG